MLDMKRVGEFIAQLRKSKGLTQSALADMLSVTHQAVSKWENGAALPDLEVLMMMRKVFGVSIDDILDCDLNNTSRPEEVPAPKLSEAANTNGQTDTITDDRIIIFTSHLFESSVSVDQCTIFGEARFKHDVNSDKVDVMGRGAFEKSLTADVISVLGMVDVGGQMQGDVISVQGRLSVGSNITCDALKNSGQTNCGGGVMCDSLENNGSITIGGGITTDGFQNSGVMTIGGGVTCDSFNSTGITTVGGGIVSDNFDSRGTITLGGGLTGDIVTLSGCSKFGGGITADSIFITLSEQDCSAAGIVADRMNVAVRAGDGNAVLRVRDIRADHIDIVNVQADFVKAECGRIGPGCRIKRLECGPDVQIHPEAEIGVAV